MVMKSTAGHDPNPNSTELKYKGVRKRKWGKWVSEIRLPNSRERIWLGSYDSPEKAARAFDAAQLCLRSPGAANLNFPDNPRQIDGAARGLSPAEIQLVASRFANSDESTPAAEQAALASGSAPSPSFSASDGAVQWENSDVSFDGGPRPFSEYYDFDLLADFGMGDLYAPQNSDSLDYYGYDQWNGSGCESSFLWNF